jgi:hypothetical protein
MQVKKHVSVKFCSVSPPTELLRKGVLGFQCLDLIDAQKRFSYLANLCKMVMRKGLCCDMTPSRKLHNF